MHICIYAYIHTSVYHVRKYKSDLIIVEYKRGSKRYQGPCKSSCMFIHKQILLFISQLVHRNVLHNVTIVLHYMCVCKSDRCMLLCLQTSEDNNKQSIG